MSTAPNPLVTIESLLARLFNAILSFFSTLTGSTPGTLAGTGAVSLTQGAAAPPRVTLPTITVEQARARAVASETNINPKDLAGWMSARGSNWDAVIRVNHQIYLDPSECGGSGAPNLTFAEASSAALAAGGIAAKLAPAAVGGPIGIAVAVGAVIIGAITQIFQHHAQAVQRDIRAQCSLIPAANNALDVIIAGVKDGTIKASDGVIGMQQLPVIFLQQAGAAKNNSPYCNGVCGNLIVLRAICYYWQSQFQSGAYG